MSVRKWKRQNRPRISKIHFTPSVLGRTSDIFHDERINRLPRGGVIFYTIHDNEVYVCFGQHRQTADLSDFGGGRKQRETIFQASAREANEESRKCFGELCDTDLLNCPCIYNNRMLIVFYKVQNLGGDIFERSHDCFDNYECLKPYEKTKAKYNEMTNLIWLSSKDLSKIFSKQPEWRMYSIIRQFLMSCKDFSSTEECIRSILT